MASTYLTSGNLSSAGNQKKWTISFWVKRAKLGVTQGILDYSVNSTNYYNFTFKSTDGLTMFNNDGGTVSYELEPSMKFRDTSGWYHIVHQYDSEQATESNRAKLWVNGVQQSSWTNENYPSQGANTKIPNSGYPINIGRQYRANTNVQYFDGSLSHFHFCDGYAYSASDFGETDATTGIWKPKTAPSVTYGTNGFFLKFENSGAFGTDSSGNGNNFTVNGTMTQNIDTPSNVFVTINALTLSASQYTLANGNLSTNGNGSNAWRSIFSTLGVTQGKYYFEMKVNAIEASDLNNFALGICDIEQIGVSASNGKFFGTSRGYGYHAKDGKKLNNDSVTANGVAYGSSWTTNDIIGCAFDLDNGKLYWSKNGTWQNSGDPESGATGTGSAFDVTTGYTYVPVLANYYSAEKVSFNFGNGYFGTTAVSSAQNPDDGIGIFEYDVPTGYRALCTKSINAEEYS